MELHRSGNAGSCASACSDFQFSAFWEPNICKCYNTCGANDPGLPGLVVHDSPPPPPPLWSERGDGNVKCFQGQEVGSRWQTDEPRCVDNRCAQKVSSQSDCQALAEAQGHSFYSYRHNPDRRGRHKCVSSAECPYNEDRLNEWRVYTDNEPVPAGWTPHQENWNCDGARGMEQHAVGTLAECTEACSDFQFAALWHIDRQLCRCYNECSGGGPTRPDFPNTVIHNGRQEEEPQPSEWRRGDDHIKCKNNRGFDWETEAGGPVCADDYCSHKVDSQSDCQTVAEAAGHHFYSFRRNPNSDGRHKCVTTEYCDDPLPDRRNEWNIFTRIA